MSIFDGFEAEQVHSDGEVILALRGELDLATSPELEGQLNRLDATQLVRLDCSELAFVDSSGLRVLLRQAERFRRAGGSMRLVRPSGPVQHVLRVAHATSLLDGH